MIFNHYQIKEEKKQIKTPKLFQQCNHSFTFSANTNKHCIKTMLNKEKP